jgi:ribosomal protein S18 acetylase RimI-like enzyme
MHRIELATLEDIDAIQRVLRETWLDTYSPYLAQDTINEVSSVWHDAARLATRVKDPDIYYAVARADSDDICGLVAAQRRLPNELFIYRLYVRPDTQHQGVGSALLNATLAHFPGVERVVLQVLTANEKALAFWRKHGFVERGITQEVVAGETICMTEMERAQA